MYPEANLVTLVQRSMFNVVQAHASSSTHPPTHSRPPFAAPFAMSHPDSPPREPRRALERHSEVEMTWIKRQPLFESRGYMLRPRFRPGWIPSWRRDPTISVLVAEDRLSSMVSDPLRL